MTDLSAKKEEQIVKSVDGTTATRYKVVEEKIDLEALRREKEGLEAQINKFEFLVYPKDASEQMKEAVDMWNGTRGYEHERAVEKLEYLNKELESLQE